MGKRKTAGASRTVSENGQPCPQTKSVRCIRNEVSVVVAIDFGTSETGVGWVSYDDDSDRVRIISPEFPAKPQNIENKVPTVLLLERTEPHNLIAFGKNAREKWHNHPDRDSALLLFEKYKLNLQCEEDYSREVTCVSLKSNFHLKASLVMQRTFEAIKDIVLRQLRLIYSSLDASSILWIVSKPCQWFDVTTVSCIPQIDGSIVHFLSRMLRRCHPTFGLNSCPNIFSYMDT